MSKINQKKFQIKTEKTINMKSFHKKNICKKLPIEK